MTTRVRARAATFLLAILVAASTSGTFGAMPSAAQSEDLDVVFDFSPSESSYVPGEAFALEFSVVNAVPVNPAYPTVVRVTQILAYFSWMGPSEWIVRNVSGDARWLNSTELQSFTMSLEVPDNATDRVYSYMFKIEYEKEVLNSGWGVFMPAPWQSALSHDFTVAEETERAASGTLAWIAAIALALAIVAVVLVLYFRMSRAGTARPSPGPAAYEGMQAVGLHGTESAPSPTRTYPVILASPGEQFPIEKGFVYLVKEKRPNIAFQMFNEATKHGAQGMLVVREHPNRLKQLHEFEAAKILWLTRRVGMDHIDPTELSLLSLEVTKFVEARPKSVVLIEGLEYIITQNDFETVLRFVNHLHDFVLAHDCAVVFVIDPRVLSTRELALLERSARIVEPVERVDTRADRPAEEVPT